MFLWLFAEIGVVEEPKVLGRSGAFLPKPKLFKSCFESYYNRRTS